MAARFLFPLVAALLVATSKGESSESCEHLTAPLAEDWAPLSDGDCTPDARPATLGQFPHHALVLCDDSMVCGGSLITSTLVLTSAICTVGCKKWTIWLGAIHRAEEQDYAWVVETIWARPHPHHSTQLGSHGNDVAVLFLPLAAPVDKNYIDVVALPSPLEVNRTFSGSRALISGYGRTANGSDCSEVLQWSEVTVLPNEVCSRFYQPGVVNNGTLCAGNTGAAFGDHGGPLVVRTEEGYQQIGVASFWGDECDPAVPAGYTRVTAVLGWITANTRLRGGASSR